MKVLCREEKLPLILLIGLNNRRENKKKELIVVLNLFVRIFIKRNKIDALKGSAIFERM